SHVSTALSARDFPRQPSRRRGVAVTFELLVHPSRMAPRRLIERRPSEPRRPDSAPFFVCRTCAARFVPTDSCDESCATGAMPRQHAGGLVREEVLHPAGALGSDCRGRRKVLCPRRDMTAPHDSGAPRPARWLHGLKRTRFVLAVAALAFGALWLLGAIAA